MLLSAVWGVFVTLITKALVSSYSADSSVEATVSDASRAGSLKGYRTSLMGSRNQERDSFDSLLPLEFHQRAMDRSR
jgi:hypothetical protein